MEILQPLLQKKLGIIIILIRIVPGIVRGNAFAGERSGKKSSEMGGEAGGHSCLASTCSECKSQTNTTGAKRGAVYLKRGKEARKVLPYESCKGFLSSDTPRPPPPLGQARQWRRTSSSTQHHYCCCFP